MPELTMNPKQKKAVESTGGPVQLLAGPGSGKTFVITQRIRCLITECGVDPSRILVITFTKAAAGEMRQRFYKLEKETASYITFGTFHAVFYSILKQTGQYRQFTLITENQKRKLLAQILHLPANALSAGHEKTEHLLQTISRLKNNGERFDLLADDRFSEEELRSLYRDYNGYLSEFGKMDFDDMGLLCLKLFREHPDVLAKWQKRYEYIMIDEFQDINPLQYEIIRMLALPENNLFIVGDDDQSIYGFRGAGPDMMQRFIKDYPTAVQLLLDVNYRCHEQIVGCSMQVIAANRNRFSKKIQAVHREGAGVLLQSFPDQEKEQEALLGMLRQTVAESRPESLKEHAVICRTNYECGMLAEKLLYHKIPFVMREVLKSRYDHFVIKDLLAYLEFADGNRSRELFHFFMNRPLRYLRKDCARAENIELKELLAYYRNDIRMQEVSRKLFHDLERVGTMRPYLAVHYIRQAVGYDDYIKENFAVEESGRLLQTADDFQEEAKKFDTFRKWNDYIGQCRRAVERKQKETERDGDDRQTPGIRLMTMHASKGLEFDTVYLPDVNEGRLPSRQSVTQEAVEEERRMFYVAMTRARKELHILYCSAENGKKVPSRFLAPLLSKKLN